jgi:hypothetical protein
LLSRDWGIDIFLFPATLAAFRCSREAILENHPAAECNHNLKGEPYMQKKFAFVIVLALTAALVAAVATAQDQPQKPAGFVRFKTTSIGIGVGASWGKGTFDYAKGGSFPIKVGGVDLAKVGVSEVEGVGAVYNLTNPEDIYGTYTAGSVGLSVLGGFKGTTMKNAKGVVIDLSATQKGISVNLGVGSIEISRP